MQFAPKTWNLLKSLRIPCTTSQFCMRVYGPVTCDETARKGEENSRFYLDKIPAKEKNRLGETRNESKSYINIVFKTIL